MPGRGHGAVSSVMADEPVRGNNGGHGGRRERLFVRTSIRGKTRAGVLYSLVCQDVRPSTPEFSPTQSPPSLTDPVPWRCVVRHYLDTRPK